MFFISFYSSASIRRISIEILLSVFMSALPDSVSLMHLTQLMYQISSPFSEFSTKVATKKLQLHGGKSVAFNKGNDPYYASFFSLATVWNHNASLFAARQLGCTRV